MVDKNMKPHLKNLFRHGLYGIIYDCDGVMIDSACANRYLYNTILNALNLPSLTREQEKFAFQATFQQALEGLVPRELHAKLQDTAQSVVNYEKDILPKIELMPYYRKFIDDAFKHGLHQAIDTNRTDFGINKVLEKFKLPPYFMPVISSSNAAPKPSPDGVHMILSSWGAMPGQALFVGDSEDDKKAAHGADVVFASFNNPELKGEINISSWDELARMLGFKE